MNGDGNNSFDKLVAGLSYEERERMFSQASRIKSTDIHTSPSENDVEGIDGLLLDKLRSESSFYRFILWIRSLFTKIPTEKIYNENLLIGIDRSVSRVNGNLVNYKYKYLDSIFYERLKTLQEVSNFFKPYFSFIKEDIGEFYVFLGSLVAPELTELIKQEADPFYLESGNDTSSELRNQILRITDDILKNMDMYSKDKIYSAIVSIHWLMCFTDGPYIHFLSQFTDISNSRFTCPFFNAETDYNSLAAILTNIVNVQPEVLQAIFLFSQRRTLSQAFKENNVTPLLTEFLEKANTMFGVLNDFMKNVPVVKIGKLVNNDYDWQPENISGVEAWFASFRNQWKKVIEHRWDDWIKERKKQMLSISLHSDFGLSDFPVMPFRPWISIWSKVNFTSDLTGGFVAWYNEEKYVESIRNFKIILLEGIFLRPENKQEYADAISEFDDANIYMRELVDKISPGGEWGKFFSQLEINRVRSMQVQNQVDALFREIQNEIHDIVTKFCKSARSMEAVLRGIFDERKDGVHESLQNFAILGGRNSQAVRDEIQESRLILKKTLYYISELEQIDTFSSN